MPKSERRPSVDRMVQSRPLVSPTSLQNRSSLTTEDPINSICSTTPPPNPPTARRPHKPSPSHGRDQAEAPGAGGELPDAKSGAGRSAGRRGAGGELRGERRGAGRAGAARQVPRPRGDRGGSAPAAAAGAEQRGAALFGGGRARVGAVRGVALRGGRGRPVARLLLQQPRGACRRAAPPAGERRGARGVYVSGWGSSRARSDSMRSSIVETQT